MATDLIHCKDWEDWVRCFNGAPPTLNTLRRAFTALLRWAFTKPENMGDLGEALACYSYDDDPNKSGIKISPLSVKDPGDTETFPGIYVSLDDGVKYSKAGMNPEMYISPDMATKFNVMQASTKVVISCRARDADISCSIADLVVMFLFALTERLFSTWGWLRVYDIEAQTEPKLTSKSETDTTKWYETKVTINVAYDYTVLVSRDSKRLKDYTVESVGDPD